MKRSRRTRYPMPLQAWLVHASRLAKSLDQSVVDTPSDDPAFLWLVGRAEEVRVFVREVLRDYLNGRSDAEQTGNVICSYLEELHTTLQVWFGEEYVPACCRAKSADPDSASRRIDGESEQSSARSTPDEADTDAIDPGNEPTTRETSSFRPPMPSGAIRPPMPSEASYTGG